MGDMNFPESPDLDKDYLDWSWDGDKWVRKSPKSSGGNSGEITTADVKLTNPQRSGFNNQEDANNYFYEAIQNGGGGGGGGNDPRITNQQITNWDMSFSWGDHSGEGYIKSESDPTVPSHVKAITLTDIANWNAGNGNGGGGGGVDPRITDAQIINWDASYSWGNHAGQGYLKSESDPTVPAHVKSISQSDINKWNNPPTGGGGDDPNAVKLTGNQTVMGVKKFLGGSTYFQNLFIEGVSAGGVGFAGDARAEFAAGVASTLYGAGNTLQVNSAGTSITGGIVCTGTIMSVDNVGGTSFTSTVGGTQLCTLYGHALANGGANGAGLYFTRDSAPQILPCRGSDFATTDNQITLGNPNKRFSKVWAVGGVSAKRRHTQNDNEAVLSVNDLIDVLDELRSATQEEKTFEGLRDSIGNCVGGIIEKLEAIQAETEEQLAQELEVYEQSPEPEPLPPLNIPEPPDFKSITNGEI